MPKFRKKPVVIEAEQCTEQQNIHTLEGIMVAQPGDWIITGVKGERYPCKPDIFAATYELVDADTALGRFVDELREALEDGGFNLCALDAAVDVNDPSTLFVNSATIARALED